MSRRPSTLDSGLSAALLAEIQGLRRDLAASRRPGAVQLLTPQQVYREYFADVASESFFFRRVRPLLTPAPVSSPRLPLFRREDVHALIANGSTQLPKRRARRIATPVGGVRSAQRTAQPKKGGLH